MVQESSIWAELLFLITVSKTDVKVISFMDTKNLSLKNQNI